VFAMPSEEAKYELYISNIREKLADYLARKEMVATDREQLTESPIQVEID